MSSRETQQKILRTALDLFNAHGSRNISTHRIAYQCGISKGNLHYHFRTKQDIVLELFSQMKAEMNAGWYEDHLTPTLEHMSYMFERQLEMIWRYRFFYRERSSLLGEMELLQSRFHDVRQRRLVEVRRFMQALIAEGYIKPFSSERELDLLITSTWILSDHWLEFAGATGDDLEGTVVRQGFDLLLAVIAPHFTDEGRRLMRRRTSELEPA